MKKSLKAINTCVGEVFPYQEGQEVCYYLPNLTGSKEAEFSN